MASKCVLLWSDIIYLSCEKMSKIRPDFKHGQQVHIVVTSWDKDNDKDETVNMDSKWVSESEWWDFDFIA